MSTTASTQQLVLGGVHNPARIRQSASSSSAVVANINVGNRFTANQRTVFNEYSGFGTATFFRVPVAGTNGWVATNGRAIAQVIQGGIAVGEIANAMPIAQLSPTLRMINRTGGGITVRQAPGTISPVVTIWGNGQIGFATHQGTPPAFWTNTTGLWARVEINGNIGWVLRSLLTLT
ncbi:MAG: hypothetical protein FWF59_11670 [Turicibacter sp.]|nr:hypothetical protein [Turicibacter sp.]